MTNEELCAVIANTGDEADLYKLWEQTDRLFYSLARKLYNSYRDWAASCGVELDDCRQVCWFAFLDTVRSYNAKPDRETKFSSFAPLHVKLHIYSLLGLRTSKREPLNQAASLDAPIATEDETMTIIDTLKDFGAEKPFENIDDADIARQILDRIALLPETQAAAVRGRLWENEPLTRVGAKLGLTSKQMYDEYLCALRTLRRDKRLREIHDAFYNINTFTKHVGYAFFKENEMSSVEWYLLKLERSLERAKADRGYNESEHGDAEANAF